MERTTYTNARNEPEPTPRTPRRGRSLRSPPPSRASPRRAPSRGTRASPRLPRRPRAPASPRAGPALAGKASRARRRRRRTSRRRRSSFAGASRVRSRASRSPRPPTLRYAYLKVVFCPPPGPTRTVARLRARRASPPATAGRVSPSPPRWPGTRARLRGATLHQAPDRVALQVHDVPRRRPRNPRRRVAQRSAAHERSRAPRKRRNRRRGARRYRSPRTHRPYASSSSSSSLDVASSSLVPGDPPEAPPREAADAAPLARPSAEPWRLAARLEPRLEPGAFFFRGRLLSGTSGSPAFWGARRPSRRPRPCARGGASRGPPPCGTARPRGAPRRARGTEP